MLAAQSGSEAPCRPIAASRSDEPSRLDRGRLGEPGHPPRRSVRHLAILWFQRVTLPPASVRPARERRLRVPDFRGSPAQMSQSRLLRNKILFPRGRARVPVISITSLAGLTGRTRRSRSCRSRTIGRACTDTRSHARKPVFSLTDISPSRSDMRNRSQGVSPVHRPNSEARLIGRSRLR